MFREMRRKKQSMSRENCIGVLNRGTSGVLALAGDDGYPYAVPISYIYQDGKIYFHSALSGHKIDAILRECKASFCVIDQDEILPEKYTTCYRSVIVFGKIKKIDEEEQKRAAIELLAQKYAPYGLETERDKEIQKFWQALCMLEMTVEHMTGKEAKELANVSLEG